MLLPFSKRGKLWEPIALELRRVLRLRTDQLLDPWLLAPRVGLHVVDGHIALELVPEDVRLHLAGDGSNNWSGGVLPQPLHDGTFLCILNPFHSRRRNKITLMEEIVHTHRGHRPSGIQCSADSVDVRQYDRGQEEEAYGIGAAALLPWQALFPPLNAGRKADELAERFDVTPHLINYRIKITGATNLYKARQRRTTHPSK